MEQLCIKYAQQTSSHPVPKSQAPREARAPALTIHRGHERQVKNLPNQHLQEANLQRKNKKAVVGSDPKGYLRPPCGRKESRRAAPGEPGRGQSEPL